MHVKKLSQEKLLPPTLNFCDEICAKMGKRCFNSEIFVFLQTKWVVYICILICMLVFQQFFFFEFAVTQSENDRSCILLLRLQKQDGSWMWVHTVLQVKENLEHSQSPVIVCTNQVLKYVFNSQIAFGVYNLLQESSDEIMILFSLILNNTWVVQKCPSHSFLIVFTNFFIIGSE